MRRGPTVYRHYPRGLGRVAVADVITKAALSPQLFKDRDCYPTGVELTASRMVIPVLNQMSHLCAVEKCEEALIRALIRSSSNEQRLLLTAS